MPSNPGFRAAPVPGVARAPGLPVGAALFAALFLLGPAPASTQDDSGEPLDSAELVEHARERQRNFERFRQSRIPPEREEREGGCDARIGRICIWFGGEGEANYPEEPVETGRGRASLIGTLLETHEQVKDPWVIGQLVHYLVEHGDFPLADQVARQCGVAQEWWCLALLGYVMHMRGDFVDAEGAFREALATMPDEEWEWWMVPRYILSGDAVEAFEDLDEHARIRQWELFWRLSDPLFMVDGNDRLTDHLARLVQVRNREDAENPYGMLWDDDMAETLVRYGRTLGWSRVHNPAQTFRRGQLRDTRRVLGHHHPNSRGYLFPEDFLKSPSDVPPESWITAPREARTWYAPPYAPDFRGLETQVGRFRRGEEMLVVGAYRTLTPVDEPVDAGLFLVPEDGGMTEKVEVGEGDAEAVFQLEVEPGRYVSSLEVLDADGRRAWRARQGVKQLPLTPGLVGISDLMILREGAPLPNTLEEAMPHIRPGITVRRDERFAVIWEVYGLRIAEPVDVTVGFTRGRPGFLARVGEFLGVIETEQPVEVQFEDVGPDQLQSVFRAVELQLPDLEPGEYTLHVRLELPGRTPTVSSRPITVVEG